MSSNRCIFCEIVDGARGAVRVLEDDLTVAFLDHRPLFVGHSLLIPKVHYPSLEYLPGDLLDPLFRNAQVLAGAVEEAMGAMGTFVALNNKVSQSVPHLHVHVVPRRPKDGLRGFFWPRHKYADGAEMEQTGAKIREALESR